MHECRVGKTLRQHEVLHQSNSFCFFALWKKIMSPLQRDSLYNVNSELLPRVISKNPWQVKLIGGSSQKNKVLKVEPQTIPTRKTSQQDKSFWL